MSKVPRLRVLLAFGFLSTPAFGTTITFESVTSGTFTPLSVASSGIAASFSSPDGSVFHIEKGFFNALTGNIILDPDEPAHLLNIVFSQPLDYISMDFALDGTAGTFFLAALSGGIGGTPLGSASASGSIPIGFKFPEGTISFGGAAFDAVVLTSSEIDFAVDNVTLNALTLEPTSALLLGTGLVVLCLTGWRRRH
jgi:hypothetical protein